MAAVIPAAANWNNDALVNGNGGGGGNSGGKIHGDNGWGGKGGGGNAGVAQIIWLYG